MWCNEIGKEESQAVNDNYLRFFLYSKRDLNPHSRNGQGILSPSCLPIPPFEHPLWIVVSGKRGSNSRPQPWQGCALPTELFPHYLLSFYFNASIFKLSLPRLDYFLLLLDKVESATEILRKKEECLCFFNSAAKIGEIPDLAKFSFVFFSFLLKDYFP